MIHNHNTRQKNLLNIPRVRLTKTQKGYTTQALQLFNHLPTGVRNLEVNKFRTTLVAYLKRRPYYSISEVLDDGLEELSTN
jgi:hypothetical protein